MPEDFHINVCFVLSKCFSHRTFYIRSNFINNHIYDFTTVIDISYMKCTSDSVITSLIYLINYFIAPFI